MEWFHRWSAKLIHTQVLLVAESSSSGYLMKMEAEASQEDATRQSDMLPDKGGGVTYLPFYLNQLSLVSIQTKFFHSELCIHTGVGLRKVYKEKCTRNSNDKSISGCQFAQLVKFLLSNKGPKIKPNSERRLHPVVYPTSLMVLQWKTSKQTNKN